VGAAFDGVHVDPGDIGDGGTDRWSMFRARRVSRTQPGLTVFRRMLRGIWVATACTNASSPALTR
jgi:hypothetical protein